MDLSGCSFSELSYSTLFNTYITNFSQLSSFYGYNPLDEKDVQQRAEKQGKAAYQDDYSKAIGDYHEELGIMEAQEAQRKKLAEEKALAIVTGQQLGIYGGPMFTIYKTLTVIALARYWEQKLNRPVVPVFWLADEDHDFEEIAWTGITGRDDFNKILFDKEGNGEPVANQLVTDQIEGFREKVKEELFDTDFTDSLWEQLNQHYTADKTHAQAFAGLMNDWFADEGLLIAGSNFPEIKHLLAPEFKKSIEQASGLYEAIEQKSSELEKDFHRQVMNGDSNLFYLNDQSRLKINKDNERWVAGDHSWSTEDLLEEIESNPERFSPNVFLRPVIQDKLLPTLGYVAGPGEIAYYGQMKSLYEQFDLEMPVIFPRFTGTLVESGITRIKDKLPFKFCEYGKRIEDLETEFVEKTETVDIEKVFGDWKDKIEASAEEPLEFINEIDPTLDGTVGKTVAGFTNELDKLKGRVYRSVKKQEEIQLRRIEKIKVNLFPDGGLQERSVSPIYFMNKYGLDIWSKLLKEVEQGGIDLSKHHLIEL
ncbi:bacillithiol biosynthesis cysteine-adding enzyme BshC [Gracilimonas mengyeensis]|uniref:Putative cysteine ligase BshC n=1 Tax=Gracilimonas mengyeensis TaxID=1302730 RepID=A0A521AI53_9BACT|nr:bacillithiol biosynthesis cysteine-adding enzyme BshC [Gracilimonas mengyeensis]SMO34496.1 bacillithiol biosynthesis cysteine-adding enzyme BshC [Gracilimonas mengyeensis]